MRPAISFITGEQAGGEEEESESLLGVGGG